jgi:hypothetical protein
VGIEVRSQKSEVRGQGTRDSNQNSFSRESKTSAVLKHGTFVDEIGLKHPLFFLILFTLLSPSVGCLTEAARREQEIYRNMPEATVDPETGEMTPGVI